MFAKLLPEEKLINAAVALKFHCPAEYDAFVAALTDRARRTSEQCIQAGPDHVRYAQGRAIESHELAVTLRELKEAEHKIRTLKLTARGQTP